MEPVAVPLPSIMDWAAVDPDQPTPAGWDVVEVVLIDSATGEPVK